MTAELPPLPHKFEYRLDLAKHVTPRLIQDQPIHRWFYFPHSFSPQLVEILLTEWKLPQQALVLDPFVGAGTTIYTAGQKGFNALGCDISPLSIFVSNSKVRVYDADKVRLGTQRVIAFVEGEGTEINIERTDRLKRAFTDAEYAVIKRLQYAISSQSEPIKNLLLLALLRIQQSVSRAVPDGGWFRWVERDCQSDLILTAFSDCVESMLADLGKADQPTAPLCEAIQHDARHLEDLRVLYPQLAQGCQAIITSPPYPNRHDYSRIFQIELLTLGLQEADIFTLRYESLRSNVEARPPEKDLPCFEIPPLLKDVIAALPENLDRRIEPMLLGYFEDMNAVLHSSYQILAPGGYVALVVGNVRHGGTMIPVDEILLAIGESLGFDAYSAWVARLRGNSAQQMGKFGREPSRESIVMLQKR
ncbi:MAG: hypothetical protein KC441_07020 [Anaerolineales bacterium]|nr:hypothetical protein [Anaerolineales bacterium]